MSLIRVEDVAFVRFRAPDLAAMRAFLLDFGLCPVEQTEDRLVARGAGPAPVVHITERGEPGFAGVGFRAANLNDLERLAKALDTPMEDFPAPGGGACIRLTDPDGRPVEVVAGQTPAAPMDEVQTSAWNRARERGRISLAKRISPGAANVVRLGHVVLNVSNFRASEQWYKARFGFITSDEVQAAPNLSIGAFLRCDRGDQPTDHHTLFLMQGPGAPGFNHAAFEVEDLDDLMRGHERLKARGRHAEWGVGRHILGSQVFDYWRDPWGHAVEHWTDGDLLTAADGSKVATLQDLLGVQWGPSAPPTMA
jgi:catechol 2,3-dioxygenase-like lactoylglutathione lyase family enzyme